MIDTTTWSEFNFCDVFTIKRGDRLRRIDQISGNIAYISSSKNNNGIDNYILPPDNMDIFENCLTLSNSGSIGYCFYHPYKFVSSDHCTIIKIKDDTVLMDIHIGLFLKPIIETMRHKYSFGREISNDRLKKETVILPVTNKGKVDWNFIKNFMMNVSKTSSFSNTEINTIKNKIGLKIDDWKEYKLIDLFDVKGAKPSYTKQEVFPGDYLYITTSNKNNGVASMSHIEHEDANVITIDSATDGMAFYQEFKFVGSDHVEVLTPKSNFMNKYIGLFIITILNLQVAKYGYGRKRAQKRIKEETLRLPVDKNDNPDWQFMENYIKSLPYSASL